MSERGRGMTERARGTRRLSVVPTPAATDRRTGSVTPAADGELAIETVGAGIRYRRRWALVDCSLQIPQGSVTAVVGRNGAGKTTLLRMLAGLLRPQAGSVAVLGEPVWPARADLLARVGYVAQQKPLYGGLCVPDLLTLGQRLNPVWDRKFATDRLRDRSVPFDLKIGKMSGGQRTQVALALAMAKRPGLLLLDEPLSALDPLARREFMGALMVDLAERDVTVVMSSHSLTDLVRVADSLVVLDAARVLIAERIDDLLAQHQVLVGPADDADRVGDRLTVIAAQRGDRQANLLVRGDDPAVRIDPRWKVQQPTVEDVVLAYLNKPVP